MPDEFMLPDDELADLMAETIQRTLETGGQLSSEGLAAVSQIFKGYLQQGVAVLEEQFQQAIS